MLSTRMRLLFSLGIVALMVGAPAWYAVRESRRFRAFREVEAGVLYRSAQLPLEAFQRIHHDKRIQTVVCLRDGSTKDDQAEEAYCRKNGVRFVRIPPRNWGPVNGIVPAEKGLAAFREVMNDPKNHPVLIHCFAGKHRTGAYVAVYRMEYQGWSNAEAMGELRRLGYVTLDDDRDVFEFLESFVPRPRPVMVQPVSRTTQP